MVMVNRIHLGKWFEMLMEPRRGCDSVEGFFLVIQEYESFIWYIYISYQRRTVIPKKTSPSSWFNHTTGSTFQASSPHFPQTTPTLEKVFFFLFFFHQKKRIYMVNIAKRGRVSTISTISLRSQSQ